MTFLRMLPLELSEVAELMEPTVEIKEGETVAGEVSAESKKLWTLFTALKKAAEQMALESKYTKTSDEYRASITEKTAKAKALEVLFWIGVIDELELWGHPDQCALRVGWQVVEFKASASPFNLLFGQP